MDQLTEIARQTNFSTLDWGIVGVYLFFSVGIGILANRYVADMADYVVAGRGIKTALGIATLTGTELGLVTVMYSAQKGFTGGFAAFHIGLMAGIATFFVGYFGFILGALRRHEVLTIPEFYGRRFGRFAQVLGGIMLAAGGILNMGMFLNAGAQFIVGVTGMDPQGNMLVWVMLTLLGLVLFYTILGGMVSVVLTDYVQFVVLSFGLIIATMLAIGQLGWNNIFETVQRLQGEDGFNPFTAPGFGIEYIIWMGFAGMGAAALWPTSVARALACESEEVVRKQFMWSSLSYAVRNIVPYFWGICAFVLIVQTPALRTVFYPEGVEAGASHSLLAMPIMLGRILPVGLLGILTAAMIAAFMSTHDSYLLCWSSVITNDIISPLIPGLSQRAQVWISRVLILVIGVLIFVVSYAYPLSQDLWDFMTVSGAIYTTGAFSVLVCGLYWKRASRVGAILSLFSGSAAVLGLEPVQHAMLAPFRLAPARAEAILAQLTAARVGLVTVTFAVVVMVVGSLLFPDASPPKSTHGEKA